MESSLTSTVTLCEVVSYTTSSIPPDFFSVIVYSYLPGESNSYNPKDALVLSLVTFTVFAAASESTGFRGALPTALSSNSNFASSYSSQALKPVLPSTKFFVTPIFAFAGV